MKIPNLDFKKGGISVSSSSSSRRSKFFLTIELKPGEGNSVRI